jgi:hypothetical protein
LNFFRQPVVKKYSELDHCLCDWRNFSRNFSAGQIGWPFHGQTKCRLVNEVLKSGCGIDGYHRNPLRKGQYFLHNQLKLPIHWSTAKPGSDNRGKSEPRN